MSRSPFLSSAVTLVACGAVLLACSNDSSGGNNTANNGSITVTPATANVLTCDTLQFKETGGVGGGLWSVAPSGAIDLKSGLYSAPNTSPATPASTITYTEGITVAQATVQLATAFLGPAATVPVNGDTNAAGTTTPFEHTFTANGSRVYTVVQGPNVGDAVVEADVYVSDDGGATFTAGAKYHTGNLECAISAVDAGDPDVLYLVYLAGHGDSTSNTGETVRLAVSEDGGKTFPTEYIVADSDNSMADFICPDVISPSADHVVVTGIVGDSETKMWAATFVSGNRGKDIGPVGTEGVEAAANPADTTSVISASDTNSSTGIACQYNDNGNGLGPRIFSNGTGQVCVTYTANFGACVPANGFMVQCSKDNGGTWSAPFSIATPTATAKNNLSGAVSPAGNVALVWLDSVASADEVMVAISKDGGTTFGAPVQYPTASRNAIAAGAYTFNPVVSWENDNVLWLSQTLNGSDTPTLMVDKTCDFGATWSGAVNAGVYEATSLMLTSTGMVQAGYDRGHTTLVTIPLAQDAQ